MMIVSRILFTVALVSSSAVLSMEKAVSIDRLWNTIMPTSSVLSCELDDVTCVALYLYNGGNINATGTIILDNLQEIRGMNLLMGCTMYGRPRLMKSLIKWGASLDCTNEFGDTALMIAAWYGRASLVRLLLKAGADPLVQNKYGANALWCAENTPLRHHPRYDGRSKNYNIPKMINNLKKAQGIAIEPEHALDSKKLVNSYDGRNNNIPKMMCSSQVVKMPVVQRNQQRNQQRTMVNHHQLRIQQ